MYKKKKERKNKKKQVLRADFNSARSTKQNKKKICGFRRARWTAHDAMEKRFESACWESFEATLAPSGQTVGNKKNITTKKKKGKENLHFPVRKMERTRCYRKTLWERALARARRARPDATFSALLHARVVALVSFATVHLNGVEKQAHISTRSALQQRARVLLYVCGFSAAVPCNVSPCAFARDKLSDRKSSRGSNYWTFPPIEMYGRLLRLLNTIKLNEKSN